MIDELLSGDPAAIGRYRLLGRLGLGDMGQVFLGQSSGGMLVAVKVIRPELADDPGFRSRFAREVTAARNVGGLFTARVVDADPDAPAPWVATAYVAGPSLAEAVERHGALPAAPVVRLAAGLAEGLAAIHAAGVVHRNLKPTNVLLSCDGPRVVDFGISQAVDTTMLAKTGMVMGSPGFMSPEAVNAEEAGPPSDIFSLGGVLAFAATGEGRFGTGPSPALVYRVLTKEPYLSRVPPELRGMVRRCLSKDPAGRPTAEDLLAGLGGGRLGAHWAAHPPGGAPDGRRPARRTRGRPARARLAARAGCRHADPLHRAGAGWQPGRSRHLDSRSGREHYGAGRSQCRETRRFAALVDGGRRRRPLGGGGEHRVRAEHVGARTPGDGTVDGGHHPGGSQYAQPVECHRQRVDVNPGRREAGHAAAALV